MKPGGSRPAAPEGRRPGQPRRSHTGPPDHARRAALRLLNELEARAIPAGGRMEQIEASLPAPEDRHLFRLLVTEALRHRLRLDWVLEEFVRGRSLAELPPAIRNALRLGAIQILLLRMPPHAAVDTAVELAARHGHRGTTGLVNAVLRRLAREGAERWEAAGRPAPGVADAGAGADPRGGDGADVIERLSVRYSHPPWIVRRFVERWGVDRAERVLAWDNTHPDYWLRLAPPVVSTPAAVPLDAIDPDAAAQPGWIPGTLRLPPGSRPAERPGFLAADWAIQDGSGILVGLIPPEVRGLVLDLCAAPGTKSGHLTDRAEPRTRVVALDLSPGRLRRLVRGLGRRRTPPPLAVAADGAQIPVRPPWDGVLIDAPCSNLGVLRRRVDLKWRALEEEIPRLAATQRRLLGAAAEGVVAGGWLVYSVCTLEPEETLERYDEFFASGGDWLPAPLPEVIPQTARGRDGEMILIPGDLETDGTYAFAAQRRS